MKKFILLVIFSVFLSFPLLAKNALIVYNGQKGRSEAYKSANYIHNLLEHFSTGQKTILNVSDYQEGMAKSRDYVFVVFEEWTPSLPTSFLKNLDQFKGEIVWLDLHLDELLKISPDKWGISYDSIIDRQDWKIFYKGEDFPKEETLLNVIFIKDEKNVSIHSTVTDSQGHIYPYVLQTKNLWYFADSPFSYALEGGRFLILSDLLHDILKENHPAHHEALIRIEDVSPEEEPSSLKKVADYLAKENIPFEVSLIPIFKNPKTQYQITLSERPEIVSALHYMVDKGGTIVLHGATHQSQGISAEDYEFWDDIEGVPIRHESLDWIDERIKLALQECFDNSLYPLAWETPHYSASKNTYRTIAKYFDTFFDRTMAAEISGTQQIFPYPVKLKDIRTIVLPENLGYIDYKRPEPESLIANAKNMLVVRDGMASFFFHPFVSLKYLKSVVKSMKKMGWKFVSIKNFPCNLKTESQWVTSSGGEGKIVLSNQYLREILMGEKGKIVKEEVSQTRSKGILAKKITIPPGSLYILEALDLLPDEKKSRFVSSSQKWLARIFKRKSEKPVLTLPKVLIISDKASTQAEDFDQKSFQSIFKVFGFNPDVQPLMKFKSIPLSDFNLLILPYSPAKQLGNIEINTVLDFIEKGGFLITEGKTALSQKIGVIFETKEVKTSEVKEVSLPTEDLRWNPPAWLNPFVVEESIILAKDAFNNFPLAIVKTIKKGKVLFLGVLFDPYTPYGISRFPFFPHYLKNFLGLPFNFRNDNLEFYFDPGLRQNASWEKLVARWKTSGIKIVYLATWHFYRKYQFNYEYFIKLCHNNGIAVYAWFEFPQVTPLFWEENPQWREKTATGKDGQCHWRMLMNLYNPQAREATKAFLWKILRDYDWDGINLAELNFDTNKGAADPSRFTPMNQDVRRDFTKSHGFDPIELFNPKSRYFWKENKNAFQDFLNFRTKIVKDLHFFFLNEIEKIKKAKKKDLETIVTSMDSLHHPEIVEECGINTLDIIPLMDSFPFTLQVEDPSRSWTKSPTRYFDYYQTYKNYIKDPRRLMFDINIIARREILSTTLPSPLLTGSELATTFFYATLPTGRAGIYSEFTAHPFDLDILPFVMNSDIKIKEKNDLLLVQATKPFMLLVDSSYRIPFLDGKQWPFYGLSEIFLPGGKHSLSFRKSHPLGLQVLSPKMSIDGEVYDFVRLENIFKLRYKSPTPVSFTFNRPLEWIKLDSEDIPFSPDYGGLILPKGEHELEIYAESPPSYAIDVIGYLSSKIFYFIGLVSVSLLLAIYIYSRAKR